MIDFIVGCVEWVLAMSTFVVCLSVIQIGAVWWFCFWGWLCCDGESELNTREKQVYGYFDRLFNSFLRQ